MPGSKLLDIVEGWTDELGPFTLKADGVAVDLTDMDVEVFFTQRDGERDERRAQVSGTVRVDDDPTTGQVYYTPAEDDFRRSGSPYGIRWKVTDTEGQSVYFPNEERDRVIVREV